jgi:hypothetical protein
VEEDRVLLGPGGQHPHHSSLEKNNKNITHNIPPSGPQSND